MARTLTAALFVFGLASVLAAAPAPAPTDGPVFIDLGPYFNGKLNENLHSDRFPGNDLASLPSGKQTFAGVKFNVGAGLIQLTSNQLKDRPEKVQGIKVGVKATKLHFLHACGYVGTDDQQIGKYVIHYDDNTAAEVEIVYGKDVVDWWIKADQKEPTRAKVAWEGDNEAAKSLCAKIKLYLTTWENPHPKKKVATIDFVATAPDGPAAPFCVAITAGDK